MQEAVCQAIKVLTVWFLHTGLWPTVICKKQSLLHSHSCPCKSHCFTGHCVFKSWSDPLVDNDICYQYFKITKQKRRYRWQREESIFILVLYKVDSGSSNNIYFLLWLMVKKKIKINDIKYQICLYHRKLISHHTHPVSRQLIFLFQLLFCLPFK